MTDSKFTPGPWTMKNTPYPDGMPYISIEAANGYLHDHTGQGFRFTGIANEADGRLIASAPDLADALQWALDLIEDDLDPEHQQALAHARAVLAQATGAA